MYTVQYWNPQRAQWCGCGYQSDDYDAALRALRDNQRMTDYTVRFRILQPSACGWHVPAYRRVSRLVFIDNFIMQFIPGLCRIWARRTSGDDQYWRVMTYAPRGYHDCERIVDDYIDRFGNLYHYTITADHDLCRPRGWTIAAYLRLSSLMSLHSI